MTYDITRARAIQLWFAVVALAAGLWFAFGTWPGGATVALLAGLSMVPAGILMLLWPGAQPLTAGEVLRAPKRL